MLCIYGLYVGLVFPQSSQIRSWMQESLRHVPSDQAVSLQFRHEVFRQLLYPRGEDRVRCSLFCDTVEMQCPLGVAKECVVEKWNGVEFSVADAASYTLDLFRANQAFFTPSKLRVTAQHVTIDQLNTQTMQTSQGGCEHLILHMQSPQNIRLYQAKGTTPFPYL